MLEKENEVSHRKSGRQKTDTQIVKITICREELEAILNTGRWSDPKGKKMRQYTTIDALINTQIDNDQYNCIFYASQTMKEVEAGVPKTVLFRGRTLNLYRSFMKQMLEYKKKMGYK